MPSNNQDRGRMPNGIHYILEATHPSFHCSTPVHLQRNLTSYLFCVKPRTEGCSATDPSWMQAALPLGRYDPAKPMVIEVSVTGKKKLNSVSGTRTVTDKLTSYLIENHTNLKLDKVYCRKLQIKTTLTILTSLFIIKISTLWSVGKEMSYIADENVNCYSL